MSKIIEFEVDDYIENEILAVAIISAPTGVYCTVQAGGIACRHAKCEGYAIPIEVFDAAGIKEIRDFDDCKSGCGWVARDLDEDSLKEQAEMIESLLQRHVNNNSQMIVFSFDHERINELMEGWWPVCIQFTQKWARDPETFKYRHQLYEKKFKGYLHLGNCD